MKIPLLIFNLLLEAVYFLFYPLWYVLTKRKGYIQALQGQGLDIHRGILFHAASLGEVAAVKPLILKICEMHPDIEIAITTSTVTGLHQAGKISGNVKAWLSALDVPHLRTKQLQRINPGLICIVETEIWPNLLAWAGKNNIAVLFLNARLSARSISRYKLIKPLLWELGKPVGTILAQSEKDAHRFAQLFSSPVINAGNLKFCLNLKEYSAEKLRSDWGFRSDDLIICIGSSRPGEEALILQLWSDLRKTFSKLKLIIAIRHPKRCEELNELLSKYPHQLLSAFNEPAAEKPILVIDTLGVLDQAYALCDLAIVGGSFYDFGGHNPLEPAFYAKAIIMGPFYQSCRDSVQKLNQGGGIVLSDKDMLKQDLSTLLNDANKRKELGSNAKKVLTKNAQALQIHLRVVMKTYEETR